MEAKDFYPIIMRTYSSNEIVELLTKEGYNISKRTFTYYATEKKVLPNPVNINNKNTYTEKHIFYLKAILILKDKGNTLYEIKEQLDKMNDDEIKLISEVYQPFNSMQILNETQALYANTSSNAEASLLYSNGISNNILNLQDRNFASTQSLATSTALFNSNTTLNSNQASYQSNIPKSIYNQKNKRTIINENIILETKNISNDCLKEIIHEIDNIYNKYKGE